MCSTVITKNIATVPLNVFFFKKHINVNHKFVMYKYIPGTFVHVVPTIGPKT